MMRDSELIVKVSFVPYFSIQSRPVESPVILISCFYSIFSQNSFQHLSMVFHKACVRNLLSKKSFHGQYQPMQYSSSHHQDQEITFLDLKLTRLHFDV